MHLIEPTHVHSCCSNRNNPLKEKRWFERQAPPESENLKRWLWFKERSKTLGCPWDSCGRHRGWGAWSQLTAEKAASEVLAVQGGGRLPGPIAPSFGRGNPQWLKPQHVSNKALPKLRGMVSFNKGSQPESFQTRLKGHPAVVSVGFKSGTMINLS